MITALPQLLAGAAVLQATAQSQGLLVGLDPDDNGDIVKGVRFVLRV